MLNEITLPVPTGYRLLVHMPKLDAKTAGGIFMPEPTKKLEESASIVGQVIAMGADAYRDDMKFPAGPWCKVGDSVIIRSYSGTRFDVKGEEYRLINDDTVEAVVADPKSVGRV